MKSDLLCALATALLMSGCTAAGTTLAPPDGGAHGEDSAIVAESSSPPDHATGDATDDAADDATNDAADDAVDGSPDSEQRDASSNDAFAATDGPSVDAGDACANLQSDPHNCGSCGHDCQGGACVMGVCQPFVIAATGCGSTGVNIATDSTNVYWSWGSCGGARPRYAFPGDCTTGGGCIVSTPKDGGTSTTLAAGLAPLAVNSTAVYYDTSSAVMSVPIAGGVATTLAPPGCTSIAADSANVYWSAADPLHPALLSAPVGGGAPTTLATGQTPRGVAVDATSVYFSDSQAGTIDALPLGGGSVTTLASGQAFPTNIDVDSNNAYWINTPTNGTVAVVSVPLGGGHPTTLATGQGYGSPIAIDSANVYWAANGTLMSVPIVGGPPTQYPSQTPICCGGPGSIAVDATSIYWTSNVGTSGWVMKLAKP